MAWIRWTFVLGFAFGGFFDGILLHQVLQWHHFLSLVPGMDDLRLQILWDGYFHVLMYLIAALALWGLWRTRARAGGAAGPPAPGTAALAAAFVLGFGVWNVVDVVLAHWILTLHRTRLDGPSPLLWDLIWLCVFGLAPIALWAWLRGRPSAPASPTLAICLLAAASGAAGAWALREPPGQRFTTVVFAPGTSPGQVFQALDAADARLLWSDRAMGVVVVAMPQARRWSLYRHRALLVGGTGVAIGCIGWSRS